MHNAINWFEIPAVDFDRAVNFYSAILGKPVRKGEFGGMPHGFFNADEAAVSGAIVKGNGEPSNGGALIYLNAETPANLSQIEGRIARSGGKVVLPKTSIGEQGWMVIFIDSEGNRVGLHSPN